MHGWVNLVSLCLCCGCIMEHWRIWLSLSDRIPVSSKHAHMSSLLKCLCACTRLYWCVDMFGDFHSFKLLTIIYWHCNNWPLLNWCLEICLVCFNEWQTFVPLVNQTCVLALLQALNCLSHIRQYYIVQCIEMLFSFIFLFSSLLYPSVCFYLFHDRPNYVL